MAIWISNGFNWFDVGGIANLHIESYDIFKKKSSIPAGVLIQEILTLFFKGTE